MSGQNFFHNKS